MTVPNMRTRIREKLVYITPDGEEFLLTTGGAKNVFSTEGWGLPQGTIHAVRGPFQQSSTPTAIRMQERKIYVTLHHFGCDRENYWINRAALVNALRLSRTDLNYPEAGSLRRYLPTGEIRQIDVFIQEGPFFVDNSPKGGIFDIAEELVFLALDPIIYDPTERSFTTTGWSCTPVEELDFPAAFPILFGAAVCTVTQNVQIQYNGTWESYPIIEVSGPATDFTITHNQTGAMLELDYTIPNGDVATFDLSYGTKTILDSAGDSLLGYLTNDSDLGMFSIQPDPIVAGGLNTFTISINNGGAGTSIVIYYFVRYAGI